MEGTHITEAEWFNAKKVLPDSPRDVLVVFKHYQSRKVWPMSVMTSGKFFVGSYQWQINHSDWNPSCDYVAQWAEIDPLRSGCMPDDFPNSVKSFSFISNKQDS